LEEEEEEEEDTESLDRFCLLAFIYLFL